MLEGKTLTSEMKNSFSTFIKLDRSRVKKSVNLELDQQK